MKNLGKPGIVRGFSIILKEVREKSGKTNHLVLMSFSLTLCMVVCKVVVLVFDSKCELCHLAL